MLPAEEFDRIVARALRRIPNRFRKLLDNVVFVLTWPVSLYRHVYEQSMTTADWLHGEACGVVAGAPTPSPAPRPAQ